ncbi:DNA binding ATP binding [Euphorbia peplus]|nr:DNA binding ATP binding [Euphorbia peplus]
MNSVVSAAELHIQKIRTRKFSIGKKNPNPLNLDLHHAVTGLSAELYTKDVHFIMELIQNAEDNEYPDGVEPTLEFVLTKTDITGLGAPSTLLIFNNEVGFSNHNIDSICSVGRSTKKGKKGLGFIGEKGIGFKSVFLVSSWPHIFSNGYYVRFSEQPEKNSGIGYIVPEWVDGKPSVSDVRDIYGSKKVLPTTVIILPLKPDKVKAVEAQLSELHPEILLFLSKIKRLYVRDYDCDPNTPNNVSTVSISSVTSHTEQKVKKADSRIVRLSVRENMSAREDTCSYYLWRQAFPVKLESRVDARKDVEEWVIVLAFPCGNRLTRGTSSVGVFSFLPTAMVTDFPFVIQADFMLASSRETIILDNKWNLGILQCIPEAFVNAFQSRLKEKLPSLKQAFTSLPVKCSPMQEFNTIRCSIRDILQQKEIVPCTDLYSRIFRLPSGVIRTSPEFQKILRQLRNEGKALTGLSSMEEVPVSGDLSHENYSESLNFLGVPIASETLALVKYIDFKGNVQLCTLSETIRQQLKVRYARESKLHDWLSKCNRELDCPGNMFFLPNSTQRALLSYNKCSNLCNWLLTVAGVKSYSAFDYADRLSKLVALNKDRKLALNLARFLYHSYMQKFIDDVQISVCRKIPIIDGSNKLRTRRDATLVSASGRSKWQKLFGVRNPFLDYYYVDLGGVYGESGLFAEYFHDIELLNFLIKHRGAVDLEGLPIPNGALAVASSELSCEQAFLLLDWIRSRRIHSCYLNENFVQSVSHGKWLKTLSGFGSPCQSVLLDDPGNIMFGMMKIFMEHYNIVDQEFYMNKIIMYADELKYLGTTFGINDLQKLIIECTRCCASSGMSKHRALSLLIFLGYLKASNLLDDEWLKAVKEGQWLKTHEGFNAPRDCVLLKADVEAEIVSKVATLPIVDEEFYENKIGSFSSELELLGVVSDIERVYKLIAENISPQNLASTNSTGSLLIFKCIRYLGPASSDLVEKIRSQQWLRTSSGLKCPAESVLADPGWKFLLNGIGVPVFDEAFYGDDIRCFVAELKEIGVTVELDSVMNMLVSQLKSCVSSSSLTPAIVFSFLEFIKLVNATSPSCLSELCSCLSTVEWLKTRHGYKTPCESILFNLKWGTISLFVDLPVIDDSFYGIGIYGYKDELKLMGVITDFVGGNAFVAKGLNYPIETSLLTKEGSVSLLECAKLMMADSGDQSLQDDFIGNLKKSKWLMTNAGYKFPEECILFDSSWDPILHRTDAPSIDEKFYGPEIFSYKDQLKVIGVKVDSADVCSFLSMLLSSLMETEIITRIYSFLNTFSWKPDCGDTSNSRVWIPDNVIGGIWVNSQLCILHDKSNLFGSHFYYLDKYYDQELLPMFSSVFGVVELPSLDDYMKLWYSWIGRSNRQVTLDVVCGFWGYVVENWNLNEDTLRHALTHVPAVTGQEIFLVRKEEAFFPDDLQMTNLFCSVHTIPLFVWLPKCGGSFIVSPRRLQNIYNALGVRKISQSIEVETSFSHFSGNLVEFPRSYRPIAKGLIKIILCFLSCPEAHMSKEKRHKAAKSVLNLSLYASISPIQSSYRLKKSKDVILEVKKSRSVCWLKAENYLLIHHRSYSKENVEFVSCFAEEIAEGLLSKEKPDLVDSLCNIIRMGFMFDFEEEAVDFLLTKANMELSKEDEDFLGKEFSSPGQSASSFGRHSGSVLELSGPSTPVALCKKQRR